MHKFFKNKKELFYPDNKFDHDIEKECDELIKELERADDSGKKLKKTSVDFVKAIEICRDFEHYLKPNYHHCTLGGSCMYRGYSDKDVDIVIYPRHKEYTLTNAQAASLLKAMPNVDYKMVTSDKYVDRAVHIVFYKGIRVELFFMTDI